MTNQLKTLHTSVPASARAEVLGGVKPTGSSPQDPQPPQSPRPDANIGMWDPKLVKPAIRESFAKLAPAVQLRNPVMFVVYVGSILTTALWLASFSKPELAGAEGPGFMLAIALWLWFTVLFANFAEALAEGRSKAQAASLRGLKAKTWAKKLETPRHGSSWHPKVAAEEPAQGRRRAGGSRRHHPVRRRSHRRRRLGRRERHHR